MAKLGLPYLHIAFRERGLATITRSKRGVVALVLQDTKVKGHYTLYTNSDIPEELSEKNKKQVQLALIGNVRTPRRVELIVEQSETAETPKFDTASQGFKDLENIRFDYLSVPFADTADSQKIATWVKGLNDNYSKRCKAVVAQSPGNSPKIINYTTPEVMDAERTYSSTEYTSRIAGLIAGTPPQIATTYSTLPELTKCTAFSRDELTKKIGDGEFVLMDDGQKIKVARGVNSLTDTSQIYGDAFKKIKKVEIMDLMADDIQHTAEDQYLGKYANTYDNKILLCDAILGYCKELELDSLLVPGSTIVDIDVEAQKAYLIQKGVKDIGDMEPQDIKEADTDDKVFIKLTTQILDAIEEITVNVVI